MHEAKSLRLINLNLLPVLEQLLKWRSVSRAAEELNLTQSAVSASLRKLRDLFDDELLVLRGREMALTSRAEQLIAPLDAVIAAAGALVEVPEFDPARASRVFRVASADYITALMAPDLLVDLGRHAPGISLQMVIGGRHTGSDIQQGIIDMLIAPEQVSDWLDMPFDQPDSPYDHEVLLVDPLVCIAARDDPDIGDDIDLPTYLAKPHAAFHLRRGIHANVETATIERLGLSQKNQILVQEFTLLPLIVARTRTLAVVPESIARIYADILPIRILTPPVVFAPLTLVMVWGKTQTRDPAHSWFRDAVRRAFA